MYVARSLGLRYLWIDSICIIQQGDDLNDWTREVEVMGKIYSNSFCNISAADAPDGQHTTFHSRGLRYLKPQIAQLNLTGHARSYLISDVKFWTKEVSDAPINTRGWVLQERLLPPRVLHFGKHQTLWECLEKDAAGIFPQGLPKAMSAKVSRFKDLTSRHIAESAGHRINPAYRSWISVVKAYMACQLSVPSDKMVALSAVAKAMRLILNDVYVVGMWRRSLKSELLWSLTKAGARSATRPHVYRAPSWSWMALDGQVYPGSLWYDNQAQWLFDVVDLQIKYSTNDDTGPVRDGWLQLRGALKQLTLVPAQSSHVYSSDDWEMFVDGVKISEHTYAGQLLPDVRLDPPYAGHACKAESDGLCCMPARDHPDNDRSIRILLLEVVDQNKGIYRRVGLALGWGKGLKQKLRRRSEMEGQFPCEEFFGGWHLIRVI